MSEITLNEAHAAFTCRESYLRPHESPCRKTFQAPLPSFEESLPACPSCGGEADLKHVLVRREVWAPLEVPAQGHTTIGWEID